MTRTSTREPDVEIDGQGFYQIRGLTRRGRLFMRRQVQGADEADVAYCDSTPYTRDIADGAVRAGLRVAVNGKPYAGEES